MDPFLSSLFANINQQMGRMIQTIPKVHNNWGSWGEEEEEDDLLTSGGWGGQSSRSGGKITVLRAGPGYHEEKEYDIGPDGQITEVTSAAPLSIMEQDALSHENPMETHLSEDDVEIFDQSKLLVSNSIEQLQKEKEKNEKEIEKKEEEIQKKVFEQMFNDTGALGDKQDQNPFLSVLRTSVEESQRFGQELIKKYHESELRADAEYVDGDTCHNYSVWSDWVACVHARLGVPRWLTAATISLGIIFSVWLCLVIPSSAPKQRLRALIIRGKPSQLSSGQSKDGVIVVEAAAMKEAEAAASAGSQQPTVAYIKVDLPPCYMDVTPGSPAPSYKSDMVRPGSPAPSYKSVDLKELPKVEEKQLEPVHAKKDSEA